MGQPPYWAGKEGQRRAVYANRRRLQRSYGKGLLRRRGELIERSFAHGYDTGGMRRTHLRGHHNILLHQLVHVGAFNLSLILRRLLGAGTPREWKNRRGRAVLLFRLVFSPGNRSEPAPIAHPGPYRGFRHVSLPTNRSHPQFCRPRNSGVVPWTANMPFPPSAQNRTFLLGRELDISIWRR